MISASLSPNTEPDDVLLALKTLFNPWKWQRGEALAGVRQWFGGEITLFSSGRVALYAILKSFGIGEGDEVIIQAFTCVALPNSILWVGAKPVYVDIDDTYNIDPQDLEKKITKKTKAVIVQHTFGIPANFTAISRVAKKYNILIVEDFAHSIGLPLIGDAAFFSFGRDKVISSVWGGGAIIRSKIKDQRSKLKTFEEELPDASKFWIFQQLLHPIAFSIILPLYDVTVGKILLIILQKLHLLSLPVFSVEKRAGRPKEIIVKFPNALAILALNQLQKLDRFSKQRREVSRYYGREGNYLRFPMLVDNPNETIQKAKRNGVLLGNWYHNIIDPSGVDLKAVGYKMGSCPRAEKAAAHIINLPTRITMSQAKYVIEQIKR